MTRHLPIALICVLSGVLGVAVPPPVGAQGPGPAQGPLPAAAPTTAPPPQANIAPRLIGATYLHLNVANLDESLAFYRDVMEMEMFENLPSRDGVFLGGVPGGTLRSARLRVPGSTFAIELVEWSGVPLKAQQRNFNDPGTVQMVFEVRGFEYKLAEAKRLGFRVLSTRGVPEFSGVLRSIMLQDPNGYVVELTDVSANPESFPGRLPGGIARAVLWITVADVEHTMSFYQQVFGMPFAAPPGSRAAQPRQQHLFDAPRLASMRTARGTFPGDFPPVNFQELSGLARQQPLRHRVMDPGGPTIPVTVREQDFMVVMASVLANGGMIGQGEVSEPMPTAPRATWIRDPNGILLRVGTPAPPGGARGARPGGAGAAR